MSIRVCSSALPLSYASASLRLNFRHLARQNGFPITPGSLSARANVWLKPTGLTRKISSYSSAGWQNTSYSDKSAFYKYAGVAGIGLGVGAYTLARKPVYCDARPLPPPPNAQPLPPPPQSAVSMYELSFGTVCGLCAGIFVKKGAKIVAFCLGGVFVLLQYFGSLSLVRVDWGRMANRFENLFYTTDANGVKRAPNVGSFLRWIVNFLTSDFQPRASFIAGFALGLRIG
ncbi:hypothetical protein BDW22DRAFT_1358587 [Trametopsis cervina]|nr:hypothetical protein BDW22DRAFT_1358587 [Trametopsis cervina]